MSPARSPREALIPVAKQASELLLESLKGFDLTIGGGETLAHPRPHAAARSSPFRSLAEYASELTEREAHGKRAANQEHTRQSLRRVAAVPSLTPRGKIEQALTLVVAKRVGADSGALRELLWTQEGALSVHRFFISMVSPVS